MDEFSREVDKEEGQSGVRGKQWDKLEELLN